MIELRQLRQFVAVAEELHFHRAARRLNMSQPPLSAAIKRIEDEVGEALVVRGQRENLLTAAGAAFAEQARQTLAAAERCVPAARAAAAGQTGRLRIGYVGSAMYGRLPAAVRAFRRAWPQVRVDLIEETTAGQIRALHEQALDLAVVLPPLADDRHLILQAFDRDRLAIAVPAEHPLAGKADLSVADLATEAFVFWPGHEGRGFFRRAFDLCHAAGFEPDIVQEARQIHGVIALVAAEAGVAIAPASMASVRSNEVHYRVLDGDPAAVFELAVARRGDCDSPVVSNFLHGVQQPR
ncbi:LysR family transcriptional regulator [uncultured Salinisphaera sp.]|uniref:LysR family transcriptional regulator n=1 Tax=uncultured Salinisphaera sp. TaxID=359372 RepID=UPI0032B16263